MIKILPELYVSLSILILFTIGLFNISKKKIYLLSLVLSIMGLVVGIWSITLRGELFYGTYNVDLLSQMFKLLILIGLFLVIYIGGGKESIFTNRFSEYYFFLYLSTLGLMLLVSSVELLTIFVALELSSYSLYILLPLRIGIERHQVESGIKYIMFGAFATGLMLYGMSYLFGIAHSTYLKVLLPEIQNLISHPIVLLSLSMIMVGFFFKLALFPFHFWSPDVYEGATNETAAFIATVPKLGAVALLLRIVTVMGVDAPTIIRFLVLLSALSMTFGNLVALVQRDVKRLLAFSSIAHAGYVLMGILCLSDLGLAAAIYHISAYLIMNLACFLVVIAVSYRGGNVFLDDLRGLYRRSPVMAFTLAVGAFALAGIPPTAGFTGKLYLFTAALKEGHLLLVIVAAINTAISLYFYLNMVRLAYTRDPGDREMPVTKRVSPIGLLLSFAIILFGLFPSFWIDYALHAVKSMLFMSS